MSNFLEEICDSLDAEIFSGDVLYTDLDTLKTYLERWQRAIDEHVSLSQEDANE